MNHKTEQVSIDRRGQYATIDEARQAIENLKSADHAKLSLIARFFARTRLQGTVVEPDDLLHDAIIKTLNGQRRWNKSVTIIKHLDRIMESDSGHNVEHRVIHGAKALPDDERKSPDLFSDPREQHIIREDLEDLFSFFADDKAALDLLHLKSQGLSASEIQTELGINKTQYETTTKRIRRRVVQHLSNRGHGYETK